MAKDKLVEQITSMDVDFTQWYTDVVKKAELADYSKVMELADVTNSKSADGDIVWIRVPPEGHLFCWC